MVDSVRWIVRILIPSAMVAYSGCELVRIRNAGWIWHGYHSAIEFFLGVVGAIWLVADVRELLSPRGDCIDGVRYCAQASINVRRRLSASPRLYALSTSSPTT